MLLYFYIARQSHAVINIKYIKERKYENMKNTKKKIHVKIKNLWANYKKYKII